MMSFSAPSQSSFNKSTLILLGNRSVKISRLILFTEIEGVFTQALNKGMTSLIFIPPLQFKQLTPYNIYVSKLKTFELSLPKGNSLKRKPHPIEVHGYSLKRCSNIEDLMGFFAHLYHKHPKNGALILHF